MLLALTNDTDVKSSMAPQDYKFVKTHSHEIPGRKILSRIIHLRAPYLGAMNGVIKSDQTTLTFNNR